MIKKILIANRGEIAARIIRTCKKMQIATVAVYSEADKDAPYIHMADESYLLGPPPVKDSYLHVDKILDIATTTQADAIHPGYGFMSENSTFAKKCEEKEIIFIGPTAKILEQMGDKITARNVMQDAGLPIIPGTTEVIVNTDEAIKKAKEIGYPIMLKASLGGGGIGMQIVQDEAELMKVFMNHSKRAETFFGDGSMFIERVLENARHIEIQLLADTYGNVIHLFERDCSIQRRNQKVVEEAPAIFVSEKTRLKMGELAVRAAREIGYTNAGTIEFLVDEQENFYFLEMNTRIQVEHPITEEITGIDIIEEQIRIASGKPLTYKQEEIQKQGHAIEARIYAEDPETFFPSPGTITHYEEPSGDHIRLEAAVKNNSQVTPFYDPMIAKLIVYGKTRNEAIRRMQQALEAYKVEGIKTNIPLLIHIMNNATFNTGNISTHFINEQF